MTRLLDIVMGYDCNLACDYCTITPAMRTRTLPANAIAHALVRARSHGVTEVSFTGGEPTLRRDLLPLVRHATSLGYTSIKVQSNGLLYSPSNLKRMVDAGVTRFHLSLHTHRADAYNAMVRREHAYEAMCAGLAAAIEADLTLVVDLIMTTGTAPHLEGAVSWLADRGVRKARLWFVSLTDGNAHRTESLPELRWLMPYVNRAFAKAKAHHLDLRSLHLPHCLLEDPERQSEDPAAGGVRLLTPDDERDLADAKLTPGAYVPACEGCEAKGACRGLRPDYLARHGDGAVAAARGQKPSHRGALPTVPS